MLLDEHLSRAVELRAQLFVLVLRVHEPAEVAVDVLERPGESLRADLEGMEHGRARALDPVEGARRRLAEGDRDQDEREQHEDPDDSAAPEGGAIARGERLRPWSGNRGVQDRAATAVSRHGTP